MGGYSGTSDLDLGKKVGNLDLDFWKFGFLGGYSGTSDLDLGKKVGNLEFWDRGYSGTSNLDLGKKSWKFGGWGVFWNFEFGLRGKFGILELRIWT